MTPELALVVTMAASALDQKGHKNTATVLKHGVKRLDDDRAEFLSLMRAVLQEFDESDAAHVWTGNFPALAEKIRTALEEIDG